MKGEDFSLEGKVAIVTGGSRGIGRAIALGLAGRGADLALCSRKLEGVEKVAGEVRDIGRKALAASVHNADGEAIRGFVKKVRQEMGRVDILVNNAGTNPVYGPLIEVTDEAWDKLMEVNLKGYFMFSRAVAPVMIEQKWGRIINIASIAGFRPEPGIGAYSVSKAGVVMLTKVLARELAQHNILVNAIAPGVIETRLSTHLTTTPELRERYLKDIPLGRFGKPEDMAGLAVYLASDASSYVTGTVILADGGLTI